MRAIFSYVCAYEALIFSSMLDLYHQTVTVCNLTRATYGKEMAKWAT